MFGLMGAADWMGVELEIREPESYLMGKVGAQ